MEFSEVVSVNVALPVAAVVFCAFLVFIFGFKSPAQPPTLDEDKKQKEKRNRKTKSKAATNGHVVTGREEVQTPVKQQTSFKPNKSPVTAKKGKSAATPELPKPKSVNDKQKTENDKKKVKKAEEKETNKKEKKPKEEIGDGWTTQISRRDKKTRGKKGEKTDSSGDEKVEVDKKETVHEKKNVNNLSKTRVVEPKETAETPQSKKKKGAKAKQDEPSEGKKVVPTVEVIVADSRDTEEAFEVQQLKKKKESKSKQEEPAEEKNVQHFNNETPKTGFAEPKEIFEVQQLKKEKGPKLPEVKPASPPPVAQAPLEDEDENFYDEKDTRAVDKKAKSPKKKKGKGTKNETAAEELPAQPVKEEVKAKPLDKVSNPPAKSHVEPVKKEEIAAPDLATQTANSSGVAFDEMGDAWTEAQPKSKKKKSRREN